MAGIKLNKEKLDRINDAVGEISVIYRPSRYKEERIFVRDLVSEIKRLWWEYERFRKEEDKVEVKADEAN